MKLRKMEIVSLILAIASFGVAYWVYPQLPERVASHWNAAGQVNGYMGRFWGAYLMPVVMLGCWILFIVIPRVDPKRENIDKFRKHFERFILMFFLFLGYIYGLTVAWNLGRRFEFSIWLAPAFAVLFWMIGAMVARAEPNWSIGIRTPWTLSSVTVWQKTHVLGGKLFKAAAVISLAGIFFPRYAIWFVLAPVLGTALFLVVYSYVEFRKESR